MANEARTDTAATPVALRREQAFTKALNTVQARQSESAAARQQEREPARAREDVTEAEARGANDEGHERAQPQRDRPDDLDLDALPADVQARYLKRERAMQADYTRKTQKLAEERKAHEARLKKLEAWEATIDRYQTLDDSKRDRARRALMGEDDEPQEDIDAEVQKFLEGIEEEGRAPAKTHLQLAVKAATKAMSEENRQLKERLDQLEGYLQNRGQHEVQQRAQSEYGAFLRHVPDYEKLPERQRIGFERYFESGLREKTDLSLIDAWNEWSEIVGESASRKTTETIRDLATRAETAPVRTEGLAGRSQRPKFKTQRDAFAYHARRNNLRF